MAHDSTKVLMGTTQSTDKNCESFSGVFDAGTAVRLRSTDVLSVTKAHGALIGVSLGIDMSDQSRSVVCREGQGVPILLTDDSAEFAYVVKGANVYVDDVTGLANIVDDGSVTTTITNAIYVSAPKKGVKADGTEVDVALIDFVGGL